MIAVVVLTYRSETAHLDACVTSVVRSGDADRLVVVDNGQTLTRERLDDLVQRAGGDVASVDLLVTHENLGYAGGMNAGIRHSLASGATAVALLNDDAEVEAGWLAPLEAAFGPRIGAVQPKVLLATAPEDAGPPRFQSAGMNVRYDGRGMDIGFGEPDVGQHDVPGEIDLFTGAAVLLSAEFLESVGGLDERYFLYYEDIDLGARGTEAGWAYRYAPASVVHHDMSTTTRTIPGLHRYWQERNRLWWLFRHGSTGQVLLGLGRSLGRLAKHPGRPQARAILHGVGGLGWCVRERRSRRTITTPVVPSPSHPNWSLR